MMVSKGHSLVTKYIEHLWWSHVQQATFGTHHGKQEKTPPVAENLWAPPASTNAPAVPARSAQTTCAIARASFHGEMGVRFVGLTPEGEVNIFGMPLFQGLPVTIHYTPCGPCGFRSAG